MVISKTYYTCFYQKWTWDGVHLTFYRTECFKDIFKQCGKTVATICPAILLSSSISWTVREASSHGEKHEALILCKCVNTQGVKRKLCGGILEGSQHLFTDYFTMQSAYGDFWGRILWILIIFQKAFKQKLYLLPVHTCLEYTGIYQLMFSLLIREYRWDWGGL